MKVELEVEGANEVAASLRLVADRLAQPPGPLLLSIADVWQTDFQENFRRQGTIETGPWAPLSLMTQDLRKRRGFAPDGPILVRTSDLLQSIRLLEQTADSISVGSNLRYAAAHQEGALEDYHLDVPGERTVPPRPFIEVHEELLVDTQEMIEAFFFGDGSEGEAVPSA